MIFEVRKLNQDELSQRIEKSLNEIKKLVAKKGSEYALDEDRLSNFRDGMHLTGIGADYYLLSLMAKHVIWVYTEARKPSIPDKDTFREHKRDIILYLELLDCLYYKEDSI